MTPTETRHKDYRRYLKRCRRERIIGWTLITLMIVLAANSIGALLYGLGPAYTNVLNLLTQLGFASIVLFSMRTDKRIEAQRAAHEAFMDRLEALNPPVEIMHAPEIAEESPRG